MRVFAFLSAWLLLASAAAFSPAPSLRARRPPSLDARTAPLRSSSGGDEVDPAWNLEVGIVGAGPSGLLLAHRLLESDLPLKRIDVYESRSDPRDLTKKLGGRAYALGLGARGRAAVQSVDEDLWTAVKGRGYECERFRLHLTKKLNFKLRDKEEGIQPSVLIYQTDLCGALLDKLEERSANADVEVGVHFDSNISHVNLASSTITIMDGTDDAAEVRLEGPYDLIVGCDGANSIVRDALVEYSPPDTFSFSQRKLLPGCFKVARFGTMPPLLDPASVALMLPEKKSLGITAFVEPTNGGGACILFAGRLSNGTEATSTEGDGEEPGLGALLFPPPDDSGDSPSKADVETVERLIVEQFPQLVGTPGIDVAARQLLSQRTGVADAVRCNTYSSGPAMTAAAICGDAAHATGGVSGQGCNSALVDSATLADCLIEHYKPAVSSANDVPTEKKAMLHQSVSSYSLAAVPEGRALYDLSFGNDGRTLPIFRNLRAMLSNVVDAAFGGRFGVGKKPLQTLLAQSSCSFVEIRRDREKYYVDEFPSDEALTDELEGLWR